RLSWRTFWLRASRSSRRSGSLRLWLLLHERHRVVVGVVKERHPKIVVGRFVHAVRLVHELDAALRERAMLLLDVLYAKIEKRAGVILLGILGRRQHEPHRADLEERQ